MRSVRSGSDPDRNREAITSWPLFLSAIATRTRHARQTTIRVTSSHAKARPAERALAAIARFLRRLTENAEQLTQPQKWRAILSRAFQAILKRRRLRAPPRRPIYRQFSGWNVPPPLIGAIGA